MTERLCKEKCGSTAPEVVREVDDGMWVAQPLDAVCRAAAVIGVEAIAHPSREAHLAVSRTIRPVGSFGLRRGESREGTALLKAPSLALFRFTFSREKVNKEGRAVGLPHIKNIR